MKYLHQIDSSSDLKNLGIPELQLLADDIRQYLISVLSQTPGHFAPNFATVELAIALHNVFDTPTDKIIWDIGHQAYPHKLLTGRRDQFPSIRQQGGISGFLHRDESEYDVFGAGHSSTSLAAALGIASARDLQKENFKVVSVIGDGGLTGGMAFEAMNTAGDYGKDLIAVLNDNQMSISATVGAFSKYFSRLTASPTYNVLRTKFKEFLSHVPTDARQVVKRLEVATKPGMLFEEFGFRYFGPIDGHDIELLLEIFTRVKDLPEPILVHVLTKKGKGYQIAENDPIGFYAVSGKFDPKTGQVLSVGSKTAKKYTDVFSETLVNFARDDQRLVAITAAMPTGTGLDKFQTLFPDRFFDVGLAEQCAVTFAAGLATEKLKPVVAIYSTFLQRSYDQILHDVCIQNLPVIFALDRAGLVGADGPTHHGVFDLSYMRHMPNIVMMAPKDENELQEMIATAVDYQEGPIALRYPRGAGIGVPLANQPKPLPIGKAEILKTGEDLLILAVGNRVYPALEAANVLEGMGVKTTVVNARFVKPLDVSLIVPLAKKIGKVITVEDNTLAGGFGSAVVELLSDHYILAHIKRLGIPDKFIEHGDVEALYSQCGCDEQGIVKAGQALCKPNPKL